MSDSICATLKTEAVFLRLPTEDVDALRRAAAEFGISTSALIRVIVSQKLTEARGAGGRMRFEVGMVEAAIE